MKKRMFGGSILVIEADFKEILSFPIQVWEFRSDSKLFQSDVVLGITALCNSCTHFSHKMQHGSLKWYDVLIYGYVSMCIFEKSLAIVGRACHKFT